MAKERAQRCRGNSDARAVDAGNASGRVCRPFRQDRGVAGAVDRCIHQNFALRRRAFNDRVVVGRGDRILDTGAARMRNHRQRKTDDDEVASPRIHLCPAGTAAVDLTFSSAQWKYLRYWPISASLRFWFGIGTLY